MYLPHIAGVSLQASHSPRRANPLVVEEKHRKMKIQELQFLRSRGRNGRDTVSSRWG